MTSKDYPYLRGFLGCAFIDYDEGGDDAEGARDFARHHSEADIVSVVREAEELLASDDDLECIVSPEANRYFETSDEARAWLSRICVALRAEITPDALVNRPSRWDPLSFLVSEYGMEWVVDRESEARFVRGPLEVIVHSQPYEVALELGLRELGQDTPSDWYMPHELCPVTAAIAGFFMFHDEAQVPRLLTLMGTALREGCESVLRGSTREFAEAERRDEIDFQRAERERIRQPAVELAEEAWKRRDYATVFAAYAPIADLLTPLESRKLDYASKKLGSDSSVNR